MGNKVCCCFGHREIWENVSPRLAATLENLIVNKGTQTFLTGGMGQFDELFSTVVRRKKLLYPKTELILVFPYLTRELTRNKVWYEQNFDSILIPSSLTGLHYKSAIQARNQWLAEHSDYIIAYVRHSSGGACKAVRYAEKIGKTVYNIAPPQ